MLWSATNKYGFGAIYNKLLKLDIFILNCYFLSTLLGPYHQSVAFVCRLNFFADHSDVANYYFIIYN